MKHSHKLMTASYRHHKHEHEFVVSSPKNDFEQCGISIMHAKLQNCVEFKMLNLTAPLEEECKKKQKNQTGIEFTEIV